MKKNLKISNLVADLTKEASVTKVEPAEEPKTISAALSGKDEVNESPLEKMASDLSEEVGFDLNISAQFEKVASDMAGASSVDEIIKIAQESGNEDLANIASMADSFADVICAKIENHFEG